MLKNHKKLIQLSVLFIDNDTKSEKALYSLLSDNIKNIEKVNSYEEALQILNKEHYDLIILSTVKNGRSFLETISKDKAVEEALKKSEIELRRHTDIIEQDLKNAQLIQSALLPRQMPQFEKLHIDYRYIPLESVGGDYFSFTSLREGGMGVFLGDIMGHGVSAALFLALVKAFADRTCRHYGLKPKEFMTHLNNSLMNNMTTHFLTAIYGHFHFNSEENGITFDFAKGGHPPPILYRNNTKQIEILNCGGGILGVSEKMDYEENSLFLQKGDKLFLYTDGAYEIMNPDNNILGIQNLCGIIRASSGLPLGKTLSSIIEQIQKYRGVSPIMDDILLIGFEVRD